MRTAGATGQGPGFASWRAILPVALAGLLMALPAPDGLAPHAWRYFAIFAGVVAALVLEPLPGGAVGLIGVVLVGAGARWTLFGADELNRAGFQPEQAAIAWVLSGFSNPTVWLIFSAFLFALGYEKTGLGRRLALVLVRRMGGRTLTLGYAIALADLALAPFTPSNTARSAGTIYPVIRNLPLLFDSRPNDPSARRIGSYLMWVAIAATSVTASMFMTGLATNLLAVELARKTVGVTLEWVPWCVAFLPVGAVLFALVPLLTWWIYPPEIKSGTEVQTWAARELAAMGTVSGKEWRLAALVLAALALWIFGGQWIHATLVALVVIAAMIVSRVVTWEEIVNYRAAWNTLAWFGTLVALADGLNRVGFVRWMAESATRVMSGASPGAMSVGLLLVFYFSHYLFASTTAHATALLPVMLIVAKAIPGIELGRFTLELCLTFGLMGILSPYASGPSPIYYGSGYLPARDYWRLGAIFGTVFLIAYLVIGLPWISWVMRAGAG